MSARQDVYHLVAHGHMNDPRRLTHAEIYHELVNDYPLIDVWRELICLVEDGWITFHESLGWVTTDKEGEPE